MIGLREKKCAAIFKGIDKTGNAMIVAHAQPACLHRTHERNTLTID